MKSLLETDGGAPRPPGSSTVVVTLRMTEALNETMRIQMTRRGFPSVAPYIKHLMRCDALEHSDDDLLAAAARVMSHDRLADLDNAIITIQNAPEEKRPRMTTKLLSILGNLAAPLRRSVRRETVEEEVAA